MKVLLRMAHKRPMEAYTADSVHSHAAGDEVDLPDHEAIALVEKGYAVPVAKRATEKAVKKPVETRKKP